MTSWLLQSLSDQFGLHVYEYGSIDRMTIDIAWRLGEQFFTSSSIFTPETGLKVFIDDIDDILAFHLKLTKHGAPNRLFTGAVKGPPMAIFLFTLGLYASNLIQMYNEEVKYNAQ